jgi:hypothetical protein
MGRACARLGALVPIGVPVSVVLACGAALAQAPLPIVDTHIHYSRNSWDGYSPDAVLAILDRAGVRRAFVSSTPDEGTVKLWERARDRIVPVLRPYRDSGELGSWHRDPSVIPYVEERLRLGIHRGIGEFHLSGADAGAEVVRRVAQLAAQHGLFLHCHCDVSGVEVLLSVAGPVPILWAHAGMSAGVDEVGRLLAAHGRLSIELALRTDVAPAGRLDPAWRALFLRHPDRVMVGTDTWVPGRWTELSRVHAWSRAWLDDLPPDVAAAIAWANAERLAGAGGGTPRSTPAGPPGRP